MWESPVTSRLPTQRAFSLLEHEWRGSIGQPFPPPHFLPLAERSHLASPQTLSQSPSGSPFSSSSLDADIPQGWPGPWARILVISFSPVL